VRAALVRAALGRWRAAALVLAALGAAGAWMLLGRIRVHGPRITSVQNRTGPHPHLS